MSWEFVLTLDPDWRGPLAQQLARALSEEIQRERLVPGDRLPSTRKLAAQLGVHRKTVVAAFFELAREGWLTTERARGTYVSRELPARAEPSVQPMARSAGFQLPPLALPESAASRRAELLLLGGVPELSFVPRAELARAYRRALHGRGARKLLDYGEERGEPLLREAVVEMLTRSRGVQTTADCINIVRGTQQGLYLAARTLLQPGDCVAVEAYSHPAFRGVFQLVGVETVPIAVDREGLDVAALETLCSTRRVNAVYLTPHHQLPTTTLSGSDLITRPWGSPDRKKLGYVINASNAGVDQNWVDMRGEHPPVVVDSVPRNYSGVPHFTADSKQFLFARPSGVNGLAAIFAEDGTTSRQFTDDKAWNYAPATGSDVSYLDNFDLGTFTGELHVVDVSRQTLEPRLIATGVDANFLPSPDGECVPLRDNLRADASCTCPPLLPLPQVPLLRSASPLQDASEAEARG